MANIKSAKKRIKITAKKTLRNKMIKSRTHTEMKKFIIAFQNGDVVKAQELFRTAVKYIDMAQSKNVYHKNNAARKKSRLAKMLNKLNA